MLTFHKLGTSQYYSHGNGYQSEQLDSDKGDVLLKPFIHCELIRPDMTCRIMPKPLQRIEFPCTDQTVQIILCNLG